MAIRNILRESDPFLHKTCRPVEAFDERLAQLLGAHLRAGMLFRESTALPNDPRLSSCRRRIGTANFS